MGVGTGPHYLLSPVLLGAPTLSGYKASAVCVCDCACARVCPISVSQREQSKVHAPLANTHTVEDGVGRKVEENAKKGGTFSSRVRSLLKSSFGVYEGREGDRAGTER